MHRSFFYTSTNKREILGLIFIGIFLILSSCSAESSSSRASNEAPPQVTPPSKPAQTAEYMKSREVEPAAIPTVSREEVLKAKQDVPKGMIYVPGGQMELGSATGLPREKPTSMHTIAPFYMDKTPVTVGQFRTFIEATNYKTEAENFGNSIVHDMKGQQAWHLVTGANWQYPRGPKDGPAPDDHPVTQVSFNDALAYCKWAKKRLPTEAEWEHAARNGENSRKIYSWGDEIKSNGVFKANFWQGSFPYVNEQKDGYLYTSPVGSFGETPLGLTDMAGNVWEWCDDWYKMYGPNGEYIESTPGQRERVMRGGSFMCEPGFCHGYRVSGRSGTTPESALFHLGFRCVRDIEI